MKNTILLSVVSAAILSMGTASAGGGSLFGGSGESSMSGGGIYAGGSFGQATTNCMIHDTFELEQDCDMDGWKLFGGYRINDMFAIEGGYYNLGKTDESVYGDLYDPDTGITVNSVEAEGEASGFGVSGVVNYEVIDKLAVFGKLGLMSYESEGTLAVTGSKDGTTMAREADASVDGTSLLWGVGGSYQVTDNIGIRGEYEGFTREDITGKDQDVGLMSAGVTFSTY